MIDFVAIERPQDLLGSIVVSKRGRDEGKLCVLVGWLPDDCALVADGKTRTAEKPKKKNMKHLIYTQYRSRELWVRFLSGEQATDQMLRDAIDDYKNNIDIDGMLEKQSRKGGTGS